MRILEACHDSGLSTFAHLWLGFAIEKRGKMVNLDHTRVPGFDTLFQDSSGLSEQSKQVLYVD